MFVGHLALGVAGKRLAPRVSLGWLLGAVLALDLLWPLFLLAGWERVRIEPGAMAFTPLVFESYPWSHSLVMAIVWGLALAALARWRGVPAEGARLLAALVVSHWVLDFITHAPDLPLWPGSPRFGLGLWHSIAGTLLVEGALWLVAIVAYRRRWRPSGAAGSVVFWSLVLVTTLPWAMGPWGPAPPSVHALALFALISWLVVPWAAWADRLAVPRGA